MGLTLTRAPFVAAGQDITSTQKRGLALAFNDRIRSGLGDCAWRIAYWWWGLWHDVRNPVYLGPDDLIGSWAPSEEALAYYIHLPKSAIGWPDSSPTMPSAAPPGEEGGANVVNPMMGYTFGNASVGYFDENGRLGDFPLGNESSAAAAWALAKQQRGAYDPDTGGQNVPAFEAGQSWLPIVWGNVSPSRSMWGAVFQRPGYQLTWGGLMPSPDWQGWCEDGETFDLLLKFTPLRDGLPVLTYSSCITYVVTTPLYYYVVAAGTGTVTASLSRSDYLEGPYSALAYPARSAGDQLQRLFHSYAASMRGSDAQRTSGLYDVDVYGFDWERFLRSQYFLAPNLGVETGGEVDASYNVHQFTGSTTIAAGTLSTPHLYRIGFVRAGAFIEASGLTGPCTIELLDGAKVLREVVCAASYSGKIELWEEDAAVATDFRVRLKTDAVFTSTDGYIRVEANEVLQYKPQTHDAFFVARMLCARPKEQDRDGSEITVSRQASDNWFQWGCLNSTGEIAASDYASENGLIENARKWTRSNIRVMLREVVKAYEVIVEDGVEKSVLHFDRYHYVSGEKLDLWEGIADEIAHTAAQKGTTNEWVMVNQLCPYSWADSTVLKSDVMADYFSLVDRCQVYDTQSRSDVGWRKHIGWEGPIAWAPSVPSGFRYYPSTNPLGISTMSLEDKERFTRSCQVYEAPDEIERAETYTVGGGDFVKVVFTRRFQHTADAPAAPLTRDFHLWDADAIALDATTNYRTLENGIMEYLLQHNLGIECQRAVMGDTSASSDLWTTYSSARGACFPKLWFVRLVPVPWEDGNTDQDEEDTSCTFDAFLQMDAYLAAMCEGFIDGQTSIAYACSTGEFSAYDYNYSRLCAEAFGDASVGLLPHALRGDEPWGHGPLPRTWMYAEVFNRFSAAVNLLTRCRIWLPVRMEQRGANGTERKLVSVEACPGVPKTCDDGLITASGTPPCPAVSFADPAWVEVKRVDANATGSLYGEDLGGGSPAGTVCDGDSAWLYGTRQVSYYRFVATDEANLAALPEIIRNMVESYQLGMVCRQGTFIQTEAFDGLTSDIAEATICNALGSPALVCGGGTYGVYKVTTQENVSCGLYTAGTLDPGCPLGGDFWRMGTGTGICLNASLVELDLVPLTGAHSVFLQAGLST